MLSQFTQHLASLTQAHLDLARALPPDAFSQKLPIPSNTIGSQFWCIIGARESYAKALIEGAWAGFACSLPKEEAESKEKVVLALERSSQVLEVALEKIDDWTDSRTNTLVDLLEHESQHQGQLIRYVYGLGHEFPQSWKDRWHL